MKGVITTADTAQVLWEEVKRQSDSSQERWLIRIADALNVPHHYKSSEPSGRKITKDFVNEDDLCVILNHWAARDGTKATYDMLFRRLEGSLFWTGRAGVCLHRLETRRPELKGMDHAQIKIVSSIFPTLSREKDKDMFTPFGLDTDTDTENTTNPIVSYNFKDTSLIRINGENNLTKSFGISLEKDPDHEKIMCGSIPWKQVVGLGRAFRKINAKLIISEEILSIMPTTVVIFFSPPRINTATEDDYRTLENESLSEIQSSIKEYFPHVVTTKLDMLRQLIVYDMEFNILKLLSDSTVTCNFVVDNSEIANGSIHPNNAALCASLTNNNNTDEYFEQFSQLHASAGFATRVKILLQKFIGLTEANKGTVKVALLDTGVNLDDLPNPRSFTKNMKNAFDTSGAAAVCSDDSDCKHGTKVGYVLAGSCHPSTEILPIKVLDSNVKGKHGTIALGLKLAREYGADIINCSFNRTLNSWGQVVSENAFEGLEEIVNVVPIVSAGNGDNAVNLIPPADLDGVISVGSVTWEGAWSRSSCGKCLANIATFGEYLAIKLQNDVSFEEGTSLAAPAVSGLLTHLISINPKLKDVKTTKMILTGTADHVKGCGRGHSPCKKQLNVSRAYQAAKNFSSGSGLPPPNDNHTSVDLRGALQDLHDA